MISLSASATIDRPIQQVFEYVSAAENDFQWQYGTLETARVSSGAVRVGASFRSIGHVMGRRLLATYEVTEYEIDRRYGFRSLSGPLESETLYTFEDTSDMARGSTTIMVRIQVRVNDSLHLNEKVFEKYLKRQLRENLLLLKRLLEAGSVPMGSRLTLDGRSPSSDPSQEGDMNAFPGR